MVFSGAEVAANSAPNKTMKLIPELIVYLFLSQEPGITWSSPQDNFPKHLFSNWQFEKMIFDFK